MENDNQKQVETIKSNKSKKISEPNPALILESGKDAATLDVSALSSPQNDLKVVANIESKEGDNFILPISTTPVKIIQTDNDKKAVQHELIRRNNIIQSHVWEKDALLKRIEYKKKELDSYRKNQIEKKTTLAELHMKREEISVPKNKFSGHKSSSSPQKNEPETLENDILRAFPDLNTLQVNFLNKILGSNIYE